MIGLNIFHSYDLGLGITNYNINNLIYAVFLLLHSFLFIINILIINTLLIYIIDFRIILILSIIFLISIYNYYLYFPKILLNDGSIVPIFISGYFNMTTFSSFQIECFSSLIYFLFLIFCYYILYKVVLKFNKSLI